MSNELPVVVLTDNEPEIITGWFKVFTEDAVAAKDELIALEALIA